MRELLSKELKEWARGYKPYAIVSFYLLFLSGTVYVSWHGDLSARGEEILYIVSVVLAFVVVFITPALASSAIALEKERKTLDLLLVTLLKPRDIVLGKMLSTLVFVALLVFTSLPVLSVGFMVGGVSPSQILKLCLVLMSIAFGITATSFLVSLTTKKLYPAYGISYGFVILLSAGSPILDDILQNNPKHGYFMIISRHVNPFFAIILEKAGNNHQYFWLLGNQVPVWLNPVVVYFLLGILCTAVSIFFFEKLVKREVV